MKETCAKLWWLEACRHLSPFKFLQNGYVTNWRRWRCQPERNLHESAVLQRCVVCQVLLLLWPGHCHSDIAECKHQTWSASNLGNPGPPHPDPCAQNVFVRSSLATLWVGVCETWNPKSTSTTPKWQLLAKRLCKLLLQMESFLLNGPMDGLLGMNFNHARSCSKSWIEPRWWWRSRAKAQAKAKIRGPPHPIRDNSVRVKFHWTRLHICIFPRLLQVSRVTILCMIIQYVDTTNAKLKLFKQQMIHSMFMPKMPV